MLVFKNIHVCRSRLYRVTKLLRDHLSPSSSKTDRTRLTLSGIRGRSCFVLRVRFCNLMFAVCESQSNNRCSMLFAREFCRTRTLPALGCLAHVRRCAPDITASSRADNLYNRNTREHVSVVGCLSAEGAKESAIFQFGRES